MSDQKNNDQQNFDTLFSSPDESKSDVGEFVEVIDVKGEEPSNVYDVSEDYTPASGGEFSDIDDGIDDDEGIFSDPQSSKKPTKKSSFGMLLFSAAVLAIVGAGGYFYMTDPQLISRIKSNFSGAEAQSDVLLPSFELSGDQTQPVAQEPAPVVSDVASVTEDMPPQPAPVEENAASVGQTETSQIPPSDMSQSIEPPPSIEGAVAPEVLAPSEAAPVEPPVTEEAVIAPQDAVPPSAIEGQATPMEGAPVEQAEVPQVVASASPEETSGNAKFIRPVEKPDPTVKLVDDVSSKAPQNQALPSTIKNDEPASPAEEKAVVDAETPVEESEAPVYFDSPSGNILSNLPAPTMNAKRGKTESIIIVNANNTKDSAKGSSKKSSSSKASVSSSKNVSIEMTTLDARVVSAGRALKLGRYDAARQMYDELYQLNPRDPRILMGRAVLFQKTGDSGQAISTYKELLNVDPSNADAIVNLAGLIRKEYPAVALSKLLDLKQMYPENAAVAAQLGVAYADSGNLEDAFRALSQASSLEPHNPLHYYNMAIIAERAQNISKAITYYEKALEVDAIHGSGRNVPRDQIYDRLTRLRSR